MFSSLMPLSQESQTSIKRNTCMLHLPHERAVVLEKSEMKKQGVQVMLASIHCPDKRPAFPSLFREG